MTSITAKFLAYRTAPKAVLAVAPVAEVLRYEHDGYLSNAETNQERLNRIREATAAGLVLGPLDLDFVRRRDDGIRSLALRSMRAADDATTFHENLIYQLRDNERLVRGGGKQSARVFVGYRARKNQPKP